MIRVNSFWKDIFREIINTKARFVSLVLITALGAMTIVGIQATAINMRNVADRTYREQMLYDLHLRSTTGFGDDDIAAIYDTPGVAQVMASYSFDVYAYIVGELRPVRTFSLPDTLNFITLVNGRTPERYDEIAIEQRALDNSGYSLGDRITLSLDNMEQFESIFATNEFTIVGTVSSPLFITFERGRTTLGSGIISYYAYLHPDAYTLNRYTDAYILMEGSFDVFHLSQEYDDLAEEWMATLTVTGNARIQAFDMYVYDAQTRIESTRATLGEIGEILAELNEAITRAENAGEEVHAFVLEAQAVWEAQYAGLAQFHAYAMALQHMPAPEWHYFTRRDGTAFDAYFQDTLRLQQLGLVFPVVFFLVAILVSLTSMSRMVEEHRTQMGIYKALGFGSSSVIVKYGLYAGVSGGLGGIVGVLIGSQLFPRIIAGAYGHLYFMPPIETPIPWGLSAIAVLASMLSVLIITIITCVRTTSGMPAELLRPKAPKPGKRVLIERLPFIWKRLGFIEKVTARNIFRYKRRFFMTLAGVAGCTALIVTAFGMRNSLGSVADLQFGEILRYDAIVHIQEARYHEQRLGLDSLIPAQQRLYSRQEATTVRTDLGQISASLIVPECADALSIFVQLASPEGTPVNIPHDGVVLTEKLARDLGLSIGDTAELRMGSGEAYTVLVLGILENYVFHYVYMSAEYYAEVFATVPYPNIVFVKGEFDERELLLINEVRAIVDMQARAGNVRDSTDALGIVTVLLLVASCALSFIVLFNLTIINLAERRRELATIKVLGFLDRETSMYICRENLAVTIIGILVGLAGGLYLNNFVISSIEINMIKFPRDMNVMIFVYAAVLSLVFALFVNFVTHFKVAVIDMVESLKSVE